MDGVTIRWCVKCQKYTVHSENTENPNEFILRCNEHKSVENN